MIDKILYIQLWENRLKVTELKSKIIFDDIPLVAIKESKKGCTVVAVGKQCESMNGDGISVTNPFSHPRLLVANFPLAEKVIQHALFKVLGKGLFNVSPRVVFQPMDKTEGGVSEIEEKLYTELCLGAGAREVIVYSGPENCSELISYEELKKSHKKKEVSSSSNILGLVGFSIMLVLVVFILYLKRS